MLLLLQNLGLDMPKVVLSRRNGEKPVYCSTSVPEDAKRISTICNANTIQACENQAVFAAELQAQHDLRKWR
jgi:hypothetical protein